MAKDKKLWIDMCAGSELKDTQGETLSVEGANIEDLEQGRGRFNDNHGKGFFNSLGRVTEAKKILKAEDCEDERQTYYWEKIKAPFVYAKGYLYNDEDHPNAKAAAAILRNIHREDSPLRMKASVEGGVLSRGLSDPTRLARTKIHSVALTFTPANNATLVEPLNINKSDSNWESDKQLIKSVMHLAETNVPSFRHIQRHASANTIYENISKIQELAKSVGIEIMIKDDIDPTTIMEKAVLNKIATNVSKINNLVKAVNALKLKENTTPATSAGKVKIASQDKQAVKLKAQDDYQQKIKQLKSSSTTPQIPKSNIQTPIDTMKVQSASKVKNINTLKNHASKAMQDPNHLNNIHTSLVERGIPAQKAKAIITKIRSHMVNDVNKSDSDIEKGDLGRAAKNLIIAGAMGVGVNSMQTPDAKKDAVKQIKPKKQIERSIASSEDKKKKAREASKWITREAIKNKLKKALMAGYGGAGSPTNLTSGGVFQAESLEDNNKKTNKTDADGFRYVTCDNCGNEQVYMKHQVKCRKCRQNFNLNKLEELL